MEKTQHIVILAAGDFPTHPEPLKALGGADLVVCCDSAYNQLSTLHSPLSTPFVVIGDGDSLSAEDERILGDRWIHVAEQDYNDLHKAMQWATAHYSNLNTRFSILGATGKREDHTLGNISYMITFAEEYPGIELEMLTDYGRITSFRGRRTYASFPRQQVSIFAADPAVPFGGSGLEFPLSEMRATRWWNATLNSALGDSFELWSDGWLTVFQTYDPK